MAAISYALIPRYATGFVIVHCSFLYQRLLIVRYLHNAHVHVKIDGGTGSVPYKETIHRYEVKTMRSLFVFPRQLLKEGNA